MMERNLPTGGVQLPDAAVEADRIQAIMINEAPPPDPDDYFYSRNESAGDMTTTLSLFQNAGVDVRNIDDILERGIYITTAVKFPKSGYEVDPEAISACWPILEHELELFPNVKAIMLMGDVAKKSFNMIVKKRTGKNAIPSGATYKIRNNEFYFGAIRVFPSYIMTGGNILIEKSKRAMITDDIKRMMKLISL